ncbi:hypothetical protein [Ensifer aridi]|uniref:hypothetical protein n=1 Tax=Ensifer aridi TaxID=1708715 RepID=UPI0030B81876
MVGGSGNDHVFGDEGNDYLFGDNGRDRPRVAGQDNDKLFGGPGDDVLFARDGRDQLTGGEGNDTFAFQFHDPVRGIETTSWPDPGYTNILDFDPTQDTSPSMRRDTTATVPVRTSSATQAHGLAIPWTPSTAARPRMRTASTSW